MKTKLQTKPRGNAGSALKSLAAKEDAAASTAAQRQQGRQEKAAAAPGRSTDSALGAVLAHQLWEGRTVVHVREAAQALLVTQQHVLNLITDGRLHAIDVSNPVSARGAGKRSGLRKSGRLARQSWRIPVSAWDNYIRENLT